MSANLPPSIRQGILNFPGATPQSKAAAERLLEEDRKVHHCLWGKPGFHNHLSHHLLAAYDLGATANQLQAIYDEEQKELDDINLADRKTKTVEKQEVEITIKNWTEYLGQEKYYACFLKFFTGEVAILGTSKVLEQYIFSPAANGNGASMTLRFVSGAMHPMIQTGYAVEFGSDAMLAQALAQTAIHNVTAPEVFVLHPQDQVTNGVGGEKPTGRQPSHGASLLAILREVYDSKILHPPMPYDPDAMLRQRMVDAMKDGRVEEIIRISNLWYIDVSRGQKELDEKVEELLWLSALLFAGVSKPGRKPRLDFFLMHMLTASLFVPSLFSVIPSMEHKAALLRTVLPVILVFLLIRGRPRINPELLMSYTAVPRPPNTTRPQPDSSALGDPREEGYVNPWPEIIAGVLHAPDAHTVKSLRSLYYAAQKYGTTPAGGAIGVFLPDGSESHAGMSKADGTIFVRAAGVLMDTLGWVSHGQKEGSWDRSALGWEGAWENGD